MENIIDFFQNLGLSKEVIVFIVSMLPIVELRGGIPLGHFGFNMPLLKTILLSLAGNITVVPLILMFLEPFNKFLSSFKGGNNFMQRLRLRSERGSRLVERFGYLGLMVFVAIPLPGSGAWTGALIALFLNMSFKKASIYIVAGVFIAGIAVGLLTYLLDIGIIRTAGILMKKY